MALDTVQQSKIQLLSLRPRRFCKSKPSIPLSHFDPAHHPALECKPSVATSSMVMDRVQQPTIQLPSLRSNLACNYLTVQVAFPLALLAMPVLVK